VRPVRLGLAALASGIAALVWQVLWIRRLSETFGHGAYAVNAVLAVFFLGLGIGARWLGRAADRSRGSIRLYVALEVAIAAAGLAFGPACSAVERLYLALAPAEWPLPRALAVQGAATAVLLAVPTIAMGGTLPALLRHAIRETREVGPLVGRLYGLNTIGAAIGAAGSVLFLVPDAGVAGATAAATALNLAAAALAWSGQHGEDAGEPAIAPQDVPRSRRHGLLLAAAAVSGFVTIGFEVLWTRALAARFLNTVYSFATILTVFLLGLGLASVATTALDRRGRVCRPVLASVLAVGGILGIASVAILSSIPTSWGSGTGSSVAVFLLRELRSSVVLMALPVLVLGLAFPMIVRLVHAEVGAVGRETGEVYLWNTVGSVAAPLAIGFFALPAVGLRASLLGVSGASVVLALFVLASSPASRRWARPAFAAGTIAAAGGIVLALPKDVRLWRDAPGDVLVDYREGTTCSVAVLDEAGGDRVLKLNNDYVLGGLKGAHLPRRQGLIPLFLHPRPERALFLGLGTGGSAGAAAAWPDLKVDALEIVPEVVDMLPWFDEANEQLAARAAEGGRVRILALDARHFVRATPLRYDVVVGDLFLPYRAGEGAMYTRDHLESVRRVLAPGGLFCQWLPLYQFRRADLRVVVATFCDVFPCAEAIWLHADPRQPVLGLVGSEARLAVDLDSIRRRMARPDLAHLLASADLRAPEPILGGWVADRPALVDWVRGAPVETRDRPRIEYSAPRNTILHPEDPSPENIAELLSIRRSAAGAGPFGTCTPEDRERIAAHQRALGHLLAVRPGAPGALEELASALAEAPSWDLVSGAIKSLGRASVDAGDLGAARRAAEILSKTGGQEHAGLYLAALVALKSGRPDEARRLALAALEKKPDHRASLELLRQLDGPAGSAR
jgi:spermidine synthase